MARPSAQAIFHTLQVAMLCAFTVLIQACDNSGGNGAGNGGAPDGQGASVEMPSRSVDLTDPDLPSSVKITLTFNQIGELTVDVDGITNPVNAVIPLGARAVATEGDSGRTYLLAQREPEPIGLNGATSASFTVPAVLTRLADWDTTNKTYTLKPPAQDDPATEFLRSYIQANGYDWDPLVLGVMLLNDNPPLDDLRKMRVASQSAMGQAFGASAGPGYTVANYTNLQQVADHFKAMGKDPARFRAITQSEAAYNQTLEKYKVADWSNPPKLSSTDPFGRLSAYRAEPQVHQLLRDYMGNHPSYRVRLEAAEAAVQWKALPGDEARWLEMATDPRQPRFVRLAATAMVYQQDGNPLAEPLLLVYAHDTPVRQQIVQPAITYWVARRTDEAIETGESVDAYWERVVGWNDLIANHPNAANIRPKIEALEKLEQQMVQKETARLDQLQGDALAGQLNELASRFQQHEAVKQALVKIAANHKDADMRFTALRALSKTPYVVFDLLEDRLRNDPDQNVKLQIVDMAANPKDNVDAWYALLIDAARSDKMEVRQRAVNRMPTTNITPPIMATLVDRAANDPAARVRQAAISRLMAANAPEAEQAIFANLEGADEVSQEVAVTAVGNVAMLYHNEPDKLMPTLQDLALTHPNADVRRTAIQRLKAYARQSPIDKILAQVLTEDASAAVQAEALFAARDLAKQTEGDARQAYLDVYLLGLKSPHGAIVGYTLRDLSQLGIQDATPYMVQAAKNVTDGELARRLYYDLKDTHPDAARQAMLAWLGADDPKARASAVRQLESDLGRDVTAVQLEPYVPALVEIAKFVGDPPAAREAYAMLQRAGVPQAIEALAAWIDSENAALRRNAVQSIGQHHTDQPAAVIPLLKKAMTDKDRATQIEASRILGKVGG